MKVYDGNNVESLILLERNTLNYNDALNEALISSTNIILVYLKAGSRDQGGMNFLLSWAQVDGLSTRTIYPEYHENCEY